MVLAYVLALSSLVLNLLRCFANTDHPHLRKGEARGEKLSKISNTADE